VQNGPARHYSTLEYSALSARDVPDVRLCPVPAFSLSSSGSGSLKNPGNETQ